LTLKLKGANASLANRIVGDVKVCPELQSFGAIHDVGQGPAMDIA